MVGNVRRKCGMELLALLVSLTVHARRAALRARLPARSALADSRRPGRRAMHAAGRAARCPAALPTGRARAAGPPVSAFQKRIRNGAAVLTDHICKEMNELNLERCACIPKNVPGADWRVLLEIVAADPARETFKARAAARPAGPAAHTGC